MSSISSKWSEEDEARALCTVWKAMMQRNEDEQSVTGPIAQGNDTAETADGKAAQETVHEEDGEEEAA